MSGDRVFPEPSIRDRRIGKKRQGERACARILGLRPGPAHLGMSYKYIRGVPSSPGDAIGFSVRYQGELLGIWDLQNRDLRRKSPPETEKIGWLISTPSVDGGVN